jgi:hypothetical protein
LPPVKAAPAATPIERIRPAASAVTLTSPEAMSSERSTVARTSWPMTLTETVKPMASFEPLRDSSFWPGCRRPRPIAPTPAMISLSSRELTVMSPATTFASLMRASVCASTRLIATVKAAALWPMPTERPTAMTSESVRAATTTPPGR